MVVVRRTRRKTRPVLGEKNVVISPCKACGRKVLVGRGDQRRPLYLLACGATVKVLPEPVTPRQNLVAIATRRMPETIR